MKSRIICSITLCSGLLLNSLAGLSQPADVFKNISAEIISPVRMNANGASCLFDFGKDAFGKVIVSLKHPQDDSLILHVGEKIRSPFSVDREPGGSVRYQRVVLKTIAGVNNYEVPFRADQRNSNPPAVILPDSFGVIMPFRYVEIENGRIPVSDISVKQKKYAYRFNDDASYFSCSDTTLNKVWDLCKYSIKATSFCGLYVDGDRERIPYEADAYINQLGHYCIDNDYSMARNTNEYFMKHPTWPTEWLLHTVLLFYNDYMYTGDPEPLIKHYEALKLKLLMDLEREDGLITVATSKVNNDFMKRLGFSNEKLRFKDIVDWPPSQQETGWKLATPEGERDGYDMVQVNTVVNTFYYAGLVHMAEIAGWMGKRRDSIFFMQKSLKTRNAINTKLFDAKKGIYLDGESSAHSSLHANMFSLAFGLVADEHKKTVTDFIKTRGMACSVYGAQYLLEGLYAAGEADYALSLMTATHDRSWYNMIRCGSTITMEAWDMKYKPNSDWNHAWGAAPANIIPRGLWGIRPVLAGQKKIIIQPQMASLTQSRIKVPFLNGSIQAEFTKDKNNREQYVILIPGDMKACFIGKLDGRSLYHNRTKQNFNGSIDLVKGINIIEIK